MNLPDPRLVSLIAIGAAFYIPLGARRGYIQGTLGFRSLAVNLVIEQVVRLAGSLALIGHWFWLIRCNRSEFCSDRHRLLYGAGQTQRPREKSATVLACRSRNVPGHDLLRRPDDYQ